MLRLTSARRHSCDFAFPARTGCFHFFEGRNVALEIEEGGKGGGWGADTLSRASEVAAGGSAEPDCFVIITW